MNIFFEYGSIQSNPLYNCSSKTVKEWEKLQGEPRAFIGYSTLIFGIFIEILYFMCLTAIVQLNLLSSSCYKIMFCLGLVDMVVNLVSAVLSGYLFIVGAVYCSYPELIFITGKIGNSGWSASCVLTIILVINRIVDVMFPLHNKLIFSNNRTWYICLISLIYFLYIFMVTKSVLFNSKVMAWIEDPLIYSDQAYQYHSQYHFVNNIGFCIISMILYSIYIIAVVKRQKKGWTPLTRNIFIQSSLIFLINCSTSLIYAILIYVPPEPWIVLVGEYNWMFAHGSPALIYVVMNRKIRNKIIKWFYKKDQKRISSILVAAEHQTH